MKSPQTTLSKEAEELIVKNFKAWDIPELQWYAMFVSGVGGICSQQNIYSSPTTFEELVRVIFWFERCATLGLGQFGMDGPTSLTGYPMGKAKIDLYHKSGMHPMGVTWSTCHKYRPEDLDGETYEMTGFIYIRHNNHYAKNHGIESNYQRWKRMYEESIKQEVKEPEKVVEAVSKPKPTPKLMLDMYDRNPIKPKVRDPYYEDF